MKKLIFSITFIFISILTINAQKNVIKVGSSDLIKLNFSYERSINETQSLNVNFGILVLDNVVNLINFEGVDEFGFETKLSGYSIIPEYRFYMGSNDAPQGFYVAPYLKYSIYPYEFTKKFKNYDISVDGAYSSIGIGGQIGYQWIVSDALSIDWTFIGLEIDRGNVSVKYNSDEDGIDFEQLKDDILGDYDDIPYISDKLNLTTGENFVKGDASIPIFGIRFGFSIGYAF